MIALRFASLALDPYPVVICAEECLSVGVCFYTRDYVPVCLCLWRNGGFHELGFVKCASEGCVPGATDAGALAQRGLRSTNSFQIRID